MREAVTLTLNPMEQRILIKGLADFRNLLIENEKPYREVEDLLIRLLEEPERGKARVRDGR